MFVHHTFWDEMTQSDPVQKGTTVKVLDQYAPALHSRFNPDYFDMTAGTVTGKVFVDREGNNRNADGKKYTEQDDCGLEWKKRW